MTDYRRTLTACKLAYIVQAVAVNFPPLLFLTFQKTFGLRLGQVTLLVTLNFLTQLVVDYLGARYADRLGYRRCIVFGMACSAVGLVGLAVLPELFPTALAGLLVSVVIYAIGSGVIEVLISPLAEACPTENKESTMALLHSFYSWGSVITILGSTAMFALLGMERWRLISCLWALVPLGNIFLFFCAPMAQIVEEGCAMSTRELLGRKIFWIMALVTVCAGAAEHAVGQWASAFAECGLQVSKTMGDLAGPCMLALMMGIARTLHGKIAHRVKLETCMAVSSFLCAVSYLLVVLPSQPAVNLIGCGLCGFFVGILWPGALSIAAKRCPRGGTAMFGLLALAGDAGCSFGPTVVGFVSQRFADNLKTGLLVAVLFPAVIFLVTLSLGHKREKILH